MYTSLAIQQQGLWVCDWPKEKVFQGGKNDWLLTINQKHNISLWPVLTLREGSEFIINSPQKVQPAMLVHGIHRIGSKSGERGRRNSHQICNPTINHKSWRSLLNNAFIIIQFVISYPWREWKTAACPITEKARIELQCSPPQDLHSGEIIYRCPSIVLCEKGSYKFVSKNDNLIKYIYSIETFYST